MASTRELDADLTCGATPRSPGTYLLFLRLDDPAEIEVGRLGRRSFEPGWYVYVGSALGGLAGRLRRHIKRGKPQRWHVDALREAADLEAVAFRLGPERLECAVAAVLAALDGASRPIARFGASDCRCPGHLISFSKEPRPALAGWSLVRPVTDEALGTALAPVVDISSRSVQAGG